MTSLPPTDDQLYRLLPAIYRIRDAAQGEPLRALLATLQQELQVLEADIEGLYDNWFIETCDDWVAPYIGDLLDVRELYAEGGPTTYGQQERRAYVANTLAYRRRKGTTPILEQLTQDVTGWRSRAVEFGRLLETTQNLNHIRPNSQTINLRANSGLGEIGTPFEQQAAYSAELRPPRRGGRYNVPNIGLYVWRLQSYPLSRVTARPVSGPDGQPSGQYYTFNPLGQDGVPLFNQPQTETDFATLAQEINVPAILRQPVLAAELAERRQSRERGDQIKGVRYFDTDPVVQIFLDGQPQPLAPERLLIQSLAADSSDSGAFPPPWLSVEQIDWDVDAPTPPARVVAIDPELGRIAVRGTPPTQVEVSYFYGFSDDIGGGPYQRLDALPTEIDPAQLPISPWRWQVQKATSPDPNPLATAIDAWNRTVTVRYGLRVGTHIPLALINVSLDVSPPRVAMITPTKPLPIFNPGIVESGLQVFRGLCPTELVVKPGIAIDREGRRLSLPFSWAFDVVNRFGAIIPELPNGVGVLVLFYKPKPQGNALELGLVSETALEGYPKGTFIPLAKLRFNHQSQLLERPDLGIRPLFNHGIIHGLDVYTRPGSLETLITAGKGVDAKGNFLVLTENYPVDLRPHQDKVMALIVRPSEQGRRRIQLLSEAEVAKLDGPYLQLALLDIPQVVLERIETQAERIGLKSTIKRTELKVTPVGENLQVSDGSIQLSAEESLTLKQSQQLDLSSLAGRTVLLFLSAQPDQGWALPANPSPRDPEDAYLGVIPVAPPAQGDVTDPLELESVDRGWIVIGDSATYCSDLPLAAPPNAQLQILAADGCRPHVLGHLRVQGWTAEKMAPGELLMNGLLVEGALQVLPGSLGKVSLQHCTLTPRAGGLQVYNGASQDRCSATGEFSLVDLVAHSLVLLWQLIGQEIGLKTKAPSMTMIQFLRFIWQQLIRGLTSPCQPLPRHNGAGTLLNGIPLTEIDNDRLEVSLDRTLSGPLHLADTTPHLHIQDSVIDKGESPNSSAVAIAASGAEINITTTTVLGRTTARLLEASNCLFTEKVTVLRHQQGCIRFSYVPVASSTPRRYQCQPDLALRQVLDDIPNGIVGLSQISLPTAPTDAPEAPTDAAPVYRVFAATDGDGVFSLRQPGDSTQAAGAWQDTSGDLSDRTLTAIAAYRWPRDAVDTLGGPQDALLVGTATGKIFRLFDADFRQLGALASADSPGEAPSLDWRQMPLAILNAAITCLYRDQEAGTGTVTLTPTDDAAYGGPGAHIVGQNTRFSSELQVADVLTLDGNDTPWRVEQLGRDDGRRPMTSRGRTVTVMGSQRISQLAANDTLTVERTVTVGGRRQTLSQTRTVLAISEAKNSTFLTVDAPFEPNLQETQDLFFTINIDTELTVKMVISPPSDVPAEAVEQPFTIHRLWAATDGGGIWRGSIDGQAWQPFNPGLTRLSLTAVIRDRQQHLWVGTAGGGAFRLTQTAAGLLWKPVNQGLTHSQVTALALNQGDSLLAATRNGVFSFDSDRKTWDEVSTGLTIQDMTVLATPTQLLTGKLSSQGKIVTGMRTFFQQEGLQPGDEFAVNGQSSVIEKVVSNTTLRLKKAISPAFDNTPYRQYDLVFAGSRDGKLFRSINGGQTWQPLDLDLRGTDITALMVEKTSGEEASGDIWLGSADGSVLRSHDQGQSWRSVLQGRPKLAQKLQILNQLQPNFTSVTYGDPGYAQLRQACPEEIWTGAEDGAEMGVFNSLKQPQREANLHNSLDEYLRFGMVAGIFYMT